MAEGGVKDNLSDAVTRAKRRIGVENPSAADDDGNVGIVRGALRAFGQGELDKFLDALHPEVTWEAPAGNFPGGESADGRDGVKEGFLADAGRTFVEFGFIPEKFLDADDENAVVVFGTFKGEGAEGEGLSEPAVMVWQFEGTTAEHVRIYADSAAFPTVVTEEREKEWEEQEKKEKEKEEKEAKGEDQSEEDSDSEDDSDDSEAKGDDDSESKSEESSESKSEESSESKSDSGSSSESDSGSESRSEDSSGDSDSGDSDSEGSSKDSEKSEA